MASSSTCRSLKARAMEIEIVEKIGEALFDTDARHTAIHGGRGSGKSWSVATWAPITTVQTQTRFVAGREFQNSIRDSSKELIERRIFELGMNDQFNITDRSIAHRHNGSEFIFVGLERNPQSIRSLEGIDIFWIEEAQHISRKTLDILLPTVRKLGSRMVWTWNPQQPDDPVDAYFRGGNPPANSRIVSVSWRDNPWFTKTAMPAEREKLERDNPARHEHIYGGGYDISFESKVFPRVRIGRPPADVELLGPYYGLDFGFSSDPTALSKCYYLPIHSTLYIVDAVKSHGVPTEQLPNLLRSFMHDPSFMIRADSSRGDTIDYLQRRGFDVRPARKGPGSVKDGISFLQGFELLVDPNAEAMRDELHCYSWPTNKLTGIVVPGANPIGVNDHLIDALRYSVVEDLVAVAASAMEEDPDGGVLLLPVWGDRARYRRDNLRWHER